MMMYVVYSRHIRFRQTHVLSITSDTITDGHQNLAKTKCVSTCTILTDGFRDHAVSLREARSSVKLAACVSSFLMIYLGPACSAIFLQLWATVPANASLSTRDMQSCRRQRQDGAERPTFCETAAKSGSECHQLKRHLHFSMLFCLLDTISDVMVRLQWLRYRQRPTRVAQDLEL